MCFGKIILYEGLDPHRPLQKDAQQNFTQNAPVESSGAPTRGPFGQIFMFKCNFIKKTNIFIVDPFMAPGVQRTTFLQIMHA